MTIVKKCFILDVARFIDPSLTVHDCRNVWRLYLAYFVYAKFTGISHDSDDNMIHYCLKFPLRILYASKIL